MSNSVIETINVYRNPDYAQIVWVSIKTNDGFAHSTTELGCGFKLSKNFLENKKTSIKSMSL